MGAKNLNPQSGQSVVDKMVEDALKAAAANNKPGAKPPVPPVIDTKAANPFQLVKLPPLPDQELWDRFDPLHKGAGIGLVRTGTLARRAMREGTHIGALLEREGDWGRAVLSSVEKWSAHLKTLTENVLADGGALVAPEYSSEFLPLLRNSTVVLESGARVIPMSGLTLGLGRQNSAASASYVGETQAIPASQPGFGQLILALKKLAALVQSSNDLLRDGQAVEQKIRDDLVAVMGLKGDATLLRSDGGAGMPKGLRYLTNSANIFAATQAGAAATFAEVALDLAKAIYKLRVANIDKYAPRQTWGWVLSPRSEQYLMSVSSTYGVFPFKEEMVTKGTIAGLPYKVTATIPENLGGSSNESEVYLAAWPTVLVGQGLAFEVMFFPNGTALDGSATMVSGISNDLSWFRAIQRHDQQLAYDKGVSVITTVKWGA